MFKYNPEKLSPELRQEIEEASEHKLYFIIQQAGSVRFRTMHDSADGRPWALSIKDSIKVEDDIFQIQAHAIRQLPKFGIEKPLDEGSDMPAQAYWDWYRGWKDHIEALPPGAWSKFEQAISAEKDDYENVSQWYPEFAKKRYDSLKAARKNRFDDIELGEKDGHS